MRRIIVGTATCGIAAGANKVLNALNEWTEQDQPQGLEVLETGCIGLCYAEPLVELQDDQDCRLYGGVTPAMALALAKGEENPDLADNLLWSKADSGHATIFGDAPRIALGRCGFVDPGSLEDYVKTGGFQAQRRMLKEMTPQEVIDEVTASGLRGRGGGGFPTGVKWSFAAGQKSDQKYVICNADEGDPGAFMDRSLLEGDPFSVLEGMVVCGFAIGASKGIVYCRAEYPRALMRLREAIVQAKSQNYLGANICGSDFTFDIKVKEGAGAFVCGEETALMASVEGRRGMPRFRPPFPAVRGLFEKPTNINNVETFANVGWILGSGAPSYATVGTEDSKGTKVFALAGKIQRGGLVEVPMGTTINELVLNVGGGVPEGHTFKAVQMGGPSGGCIPASMGDLAIDYQNIVKTGAIMGSGGVIIMDDTTCMVDVARYFLSFTQAESCGKCTFCRIGTKRMLEILERITAGEGQEEDIDTLLDLCGKIKVSTLCGLGQTAPNPVLTTIKYFRAEYEAHIRDKKCPAHSCNALVEYSVSPDKCTGCTLCTKTCPVDAISGERKAMHVIDQEACIQCGKCITVCNFDAIIKE
jgi:NADH-quinone oxidoreductase subunit F